ncbi:exonuclease, partial [Escherichia coli 88.1467]
HEA